MTIAFTHGKLRLLGELDEAVLDEQRTAHLPDCSVPSLDTMLGVLPEECRTIAGLLAEGRTAREIAAIYGGEYVQRTMTRIARILAPLAESVAKVPRTVPVELSTVPRWGRRWQPVCRRRTRYEITRPHGGWHIDNNARFHPWEN